MRQVRNRTTTIGDVTIAQARFYAYAKLVRLICITSGYLTVSINKASCNHRFKYYSVVGLAVPGHVVGTIDLWRCLNCGSIDANPRRIGDLKPPSTIGFNILGDGEKWAILACYDNKAPNNWELIRAEPGLSITHECLGPEKSFLVDSNYKITLQNGKLPDRHDLKLAEDYMEKTILLVK